jgi:hypothetical protein
MILKIFRIAIFKTTTLTSCYSCCLQLLILATLTVCYSFLLATLNFITTLKNCTLMYPSFRIERIETNHKETSISLEMLSFLGGFKSLVQFKRSLIDNTTFRLDYQYTFAILCICSILTTAKQYFGDPIDCIVDGVPGSKFTQ